jgi:hypothetical protein
MSQCDHVQLPAWFPGTARHLAVYRFGRAGARPKVYVQAGIHADELPANLVAHHLKALLAEAEREGRIAGEIVLVPVANPLGLSNVTMSDHLGRYHQATGQNFNRGWPNVAAEAVNAAAEAAGDDASANTAALREAVGKALGRRSVQSEAQMLQLTLMRLAYDADIVLDLHTDSEAELHLYLDPDQWPAAADLAALLKAPVVMFARRSGEDPFEETVSLPFVLARERGIAVGLPLAVVVEVRGEGDVRHDLAAKDAAALLAFLTHRGAVAGGPVDVPAFAGIAAPFEATQVLRAPRGGILVYLAEVGTMVKPGDPIAEIVDPMAPPGEAVAVVKAETEGRFFARKGERLAWPGAAFGKIHGTRPLAGREPGKLLYD